MSKDKEIVLKISESGEKRIAQNANNHFPFLHSAVYPKQSSAQISKLEMEKDYDSPLRKGRLNYVLSVKKCSKKASHIWTMTLLFVIPVSIMVTIAAFGLVTIIIHKPSFNFIYLAFSEVNNTFRIRT